jgi:hypothetical protein
MCMYVSGAGHLFVRQVARMKQSTVQAVLVAVRM